jgi:hypothetical protein
MKLGAPIEAKVLESVFAFDREVIPAGALVSGEVSRLSPASKWTRIQAMLNGNFTPLRIAHVEFTDLKLPDGRSLPVPTLETEGLNSFFIEPPKKAPKHPPAAEHGGILGTAKHTAKEQIEAAIDARTHGIASILRGPNKRERMIDFLWGKLPYHPQYLRRGVRFDAPLRDPLAFGAAQVPQEELGMLGTQPPAASRARVRLLTELDSASSKVGEPVNAVLSAPLFTASGSSVRKLLLPEGTHLTGAIVAVKKARSFHRPGQLRFTFQSVDLPEECAKLRRDPMPGGVVRATIGTLATLQGAEGTGSAPIEVDPEGGVKTHESKTRFIAPAIALVLATKAADNDTGKHTTNGGGDPNVSGRTIGGGLGFGLVGAVLSQSSKYVGAAFGYYGFAWSFYTNVVARGSDVQFANNTMMDITFGDARTPSRK